MLNNENQKINLLEGLKGLKNSDLLNGYSSIFILCDSNTHSNCLPLLLSSLNLKQFEIIEIPAGESQKDIAVCSKLWTRLNDLGADRSSMILNLGGGVICDLGGFVASTFKRGIDFINIPTTMLAMVDAAIGGKTGINLGHIKNQVGTFSFPITTVVEPDFLDTLPQTEILYGFAETIKHALIADGKFWDEISAINEINKQSTKSTIVKSASIKTQIAENDFQEKTIRKTLNFGHTVGHGLESWFIENKTPIAHGLAVALGMGIEIEIAHKYFQLEEDQAKAIKSFLSSHYNFESLKEVDFNQVWQWMKFDKKNIGESVRASLVNQIGTCDFNLEIKKEMLLDAAKSLTKI